MFDAYEGQGCWDFRNQNTKEFTHCFHIYPAMMIPQVARGLIDEFAVQGGVLFDPYCGSGTSLVEGRLAKMNVVGTDLNPTARMIARTKAMSHDLSILVQDAALVLNDLEDALEAETDFTRFPEPNYVTYARLLDWFPSKTIAHVQLVLQRISNTSKSSQDFLLVTLSECLRVVSYQRNGEFKLYRIPSEERSDFFVPLFNEFRKRVERNLNGVRAYMDCLDSSTTVQVHGFNTVETDGSEHLANGVDLVLTSPPYGDSATTVAYAQFSWLSNAWLGVDDGAPGALDRKLMGGRKTPVALFGCEPVDEAVNAIKAEDQTRAQQVMHFLTEYQQSMTNVASLVNPGGHVCYVVGNRTVKGVQIPTDIFTAWVFAQQGFDYLKTYVRDIPSKRMPMRNSPSNVAGMTAATMHHEYLVIARKP